MIEKIGYFVYLSIQRKKRRVAIAAAVHNQPQLGPNREVQALVISKYIVH
jgi:hypothetical protein